MRKFGLTLFASVLLAPGTVRAEDGILLDYRDDAFVMGQAFYPEAERRRLAALLKEASAEAASEMGESFAILGDAAGAFPDGGDRVYLIQGSAPVAIDPFPSGAAPVLLVTGPDGSAAAFRLPAENQYQRLVAAADGDGDGRDEVLLEGSFTNMGQTVTSLDVVRLADKGIAQPVETLREVHVEACDNPVGERSRSASTVRVGSGRFEADSHALPCP